MKLQKFSDFEMMSLAAAHHILDAVRAVPETKICLATGSSPKRTYELLVEHGGSAAFKSAQIVKLDEWGGLEQNHPATCEQYLRDHFLSPLKISEKNYISFISKAANQANECERVQNELRRIGGLDICVLGLGANGHLGLNEPAHTLTPHVHVAKLAEQTMKHTMLVSGEAQPDWGYTLGMSDLLQAKEIIMLVNGEHKAAQLKRMMTQKLDPQFPASFLWLHPNVIVYTDIDF